MKIFIKKNPDKFFNAIKNNHNVTAEHDEVSFIDSNAISEDQLRTALPSGNLTKEANCVSRGFGSGQGGSGAGVSSGLGSSNTIFANPGFYSPIHTNRNWQTPSKRKEIYLWLYHKDTEFLQEDLTFTKTNNLNLQFDSIIEDTKTNGRVYNIIKSKKIFGGNGELRQPIKFFERECCQKKFIGVKANGCYQKLKLSEEHNVYVIKGKELRKIVKNYGQKSYREGIRGSHKKRNFIENNDWEIKKIRSDKLEIGDFLLTPIPKINENRLSEYSNNDAWLIGLAIADASFNKSGGLRLNVNIKEYPYFEKYLIDSLDNFNKCIHTNSDKCFRIGKQSKKTKKLAKAITGKLANKKFTSIVRNFNKEQILNLLAGYFDGDGSFNKENKLVANNSSKDMADQLYFLMLMCGIHASIGKYKKSPNPINFGKPSTDYYYRLFVPASDIDILKPYMKSNKIPSEFEFNSKKGDRVLKFFTEDNEKNKYYAQSIRLLEEFDYSGIGYDLQIDPERSYIASGFKVSNCRFFAAQEPTVAASLRFFSQFPFSEDYTHVINDPIRKEYFDNMRKRLGINKDFLAQIALEYFKLGDVFLQVSIDGELRAGSGGRVIGITILNPDHMEVQLNPFNPGKPIITMMPDKTFEAIIKSKKPAAIYNSIPDKVKKLIESGQPISFDPNLITHLRHDPVAYQAYGQSLLYPIFTILAYQDQLRNAQWTVAQRHILPIKIVKLGSDSFPATAADIANTQAQLAATANDPNLTLVTHHAFNLTFEGATGKILQLTKEYDLIEKDIIKGLGVNETLLSGGTQSYAGSALGMEATIQRLKHIQELIGNFITERVYRLESLMQGFLKEDLSGNKILDYPNIKWGDLNLRDETQQNNFYLQLWDKQIVSTQFMCERLGIDYDIETERVRLEQEFQQQMGIAPVGGDGKGGLGGGFKGGGGGIGGSISDSLKGNLPGGRSGLGLPDDGLAPNMSGGEGSKPGPGGGSAGAGGGIAAPSSDLQMIKNVMPKVHRPNKFKIRKKEQLPTEEEWDLMGKKKVKTEEISEESPYFMYPKKRGEIGAFRFNKLEAKMYQELIKARDNGNIPYGLNFQCCPEPHQYPKYIVDFMYPELKLIIECDGKRFHSTDEDILKDTERDNNLSKNGWLVLRFKEDEINYSIPDVIQKIIQTVKQIEGS